MASPKKLKVVLFDEVTIELDEIWQWNADHYGESHANTYLAFVRQQIYGLDERYHRGRAVAGRPDLRYLLIRRKARGYGHVVVYRLTDASVEVLHVFHSAQDWQSRLEEESGEI